MRRRKSKTRYFTEALPVFILYGIFRALPLAAASDAAGFIARNIGPMLGINKIARRNLGIAFPGIATSEQNAIIKGMWDNLGRVVGEFPHAHSKAMERRIEISGADNIPAEGSIMISGHLANWELLVTAARMKGIILNPVYRHANNPFINNILIKRRQREGSQLFSKGKGGAMGIVKALKSGGHIGMLVDQKMNDGLAVPFFGQNAMTAHATARLHFQTGRPVIPVRTIRLNGCNFRVEVLPPINIETIGDETKDAYALMLEINKLLENWIREHPGQWFWLHKRWPVQGSGVRDQGSV